MPQFYQPKTRTKKMPNDVNEAIKIIEGIRRHQVNSEDKLSNMEKQVSDLKGAIKKLTEVQEKPVYIEQKNDGLKKFIRKDGSIRLYTEKSAVNLQGYGMVNTVEEGLIDTESNHSNWHHELKDMINKRNLLKTFCPHTRQLD